MTASRTILYLGTYERDYPRNQQLIRLLRRSGSRVIEIHQPFWERYQDKSRGFSGPGKLLALFALIRAYLLLVARSLSWMRRADAVMIGYIGQLDMLVLAPLFRLNGTPVMFNPLVTLTDTVVEDRSLVGEGSLAARGLHLIDALALKLASAVVVDTPENAAYLGDRFGVAPCKIHVIDVGADESMFTGPGGITRQRSNELHVLFYGKMIPLHGIETILAAIELLESRHGPRYSFEIIGRGQLEDLVTRFQERYPDAPVTYRPWVAYRRLPQRIASADVVLGVFGTGEKAGRVVPNKVYQAMAMGAPIITRDAPAARRVLQHEQSAMLVPPGDPEALSGAIEALRDADLRGRLGQNARAAFELWGSDGALSTSVEKLLSQVAPAGEPKSRPEQPR